ncbi:MAG: hypothetical protein HAW67_05335 [Endozoicomonadaceae bacterium]|nr:hypothetical protein [Endozoicomonadaceae bacterium]
MTTLEIKRPDTEHLSERFLTTRKILTDLLPEQQWHDPNNQDHVNLFCFAKKTFDTAAAKNDALLWIRESNDGSIYINGEYTTEGNNILSTHSLTVTPDMDRKVMCQSFNQYLTGAGNRIDNSRMRKVHLDRKQDKFQSEPKPFRTPPPKF